MEEYIQDPTVYHHQGNSKVSQFGRWDHFLISFDWVSHALLVLKSGKKRYRMRIRSYLSEMTSHTLSNRVRDHSAFESKPLHKKSPKVLNSPYSASFWHSKALTQLTALCPAECKSIFFISTIQHYLPSSASAFCDWAMFFSTLSTISRTSSRSALFLLMLFGSVLARMWPFARSLCIAAN